MCATQTFFSTKKIGLIVRIVHNSVHIFYNCLIFKRVCGERGSQPYVLLAALSCAFRWFSAVFGWLRLLSVVFYCRLMAVIRGK